MLWGKKEKSGCDFSEGFIPRRLTHIRSRAPLFVEAIGAEAVQ